MASLHLVEGVFFLVFLTRALPQANLQLAFGSMEFTPNRVIPMEGRCCLYQTPKELRLIQLRQ